MWTFREGLGAPGRVHVSACTAALIREQCSDLIPEERGVINVPAKGKVCCKCLINIHSMALCMTRCIEFQ